MKKEDFTLEKLHKVLKYFENQNRTQENRDFTLHISNVTYESDTIEEILQQIAFVALKENKDYDSIIYCALNMGIDLGIKYKEFLDKEQKECLTKQKIN